MAFAVIWSPTKGFALLAGGLLFTSVVLRPPVAAYVLIATTPLVVGIDRSALVPVLRPNEALLVVLGAALITRGVIFLWSGGRWDPHFRAIDWVLLLLAITSSVLPLLWEGLRGQAISGDDLLYSLTLWKYYALFLTVRASIHTERQVRNCLYLSMAAASVVAIIAVLQSLKLFGIPHLLASYYAPFGTTTGLSINRGTSTLASAIATGDVMAFNLAIALSLLARDGKHRGLLVAASLLFAFGGLATGEFSAVIALVTVVIAIGWVTRTLTRKLLAMLAVAAIAGFALQPVIARRLHNFSGGLPTGWVDRLANLRMYFWPRLFSHFNFVLGVRPSPRIATSHFSTGYVWIESGHTWLLWTGGIPLLGMFFVFLAVTIRQALRTSREGGDPGRAVAMATLAALVTVAVLMTFDPHLTLRGSADLLFTLLALQWARIPRSASTPVRPGGTESPVGVAGLRR